MSACLKIKWNKLSFSEDSENKKLDPIIDELAKKLPNDKPILFFFGSSKTIAPRKGSKKPVLTKPAKKSQALADCFNDKSFKVQVALKFFNCYDIDVSNISISESPVICEENAPLLVVYYNGKILKKITSASAGRMYSLLSLTLKTNDFDINSLNKEINKPLRAFYDSEKKLYFKQKEHDRLNKDYAEDPKKSKKSRVDKINKEYTESVTKRDGCRSNFLTVLNNFLSENSENSLN